MDSRLRPKVITYCLIWKNCRFELNIRTWWGSSKGRVTGPARPGPLVESLMFRYGLDR